MKRILLSIGFVLLVILVLGFLAPKEYVAVRNVSIEAPRAFVYEHIKSLEDLHAWSYPMFQDSAIDVSYEGTPGTVGSSARWTRKLSMEVGAEEILRVVPLSRMETRIRTIRPWESLSHSYYYINGEGEKSTLEWNFEGHSPFPFNIRNLFINMDHIQGKIHEQSLEQLKTLVERGYIGHQLGISVEHSPHVSWPIVKHTIGANVLPESVIFESFDHKRKEINEKSEFLPRMFMFERTSRDSVTVGLVLQHNYSEDSIVLDSVILEHGRLLKIEHVGDYQGIMAKHGVIKSYIEDEGWNQSWPIELEYVVNPLNETDTSKWVTIITYRLENE